MVFKNRGVRIAIHVNDPILVVVVVVRAVFIHAAIFVIVDSVKTITKVFIHQTVPIVISSIRGFFVHAAIEVIVKTITRLHRTLHVEERLFHQIVGVAIVRKILPQVGVALVRTEGH